MVGIIVSKDIRTVGQYGNYEVIGPVKLPLMLSDKSLSDFTAFYFGFPNAQYEVLVKGDVQNSKSILVRIQSRCKWGIEYGSQYCDCKWQLDESKRMIAKEGKGLIIYAHSQNGKGVGLRNHSLIYAEGQRRGFELVVDSYICLGFKEDYRNYSDVMDILKHYGIKNIRLLTNSPVRIEFLERSGIKVERVELQAPLTDYLKEEYTVKVRKLGHLLKLENSSIS